MRNTLFIGVLFSSVLLHGQAVTKDSSAMLVAHYEEASRTSEADPTQPPTDGSTAFSSLRVSTGIIWPRLIFEPAFKLSANDFGQQDPGFAHLIVSFRVDEHGKTHHVRVVKAVNPAVDGRVLDAVRHYRFAPATLDSQKVAVDINMTVNFERR